MKNIFVEVREIQVMSQRKFQSALFKGLMRVAGNVDGVRAHERVGHARIIDQEHDGGGIVAQALKGCNFLQVKAIFGSIVA